MGDRVEVVHAPLVSHTIGNTEWTWYRLDDVPLFSLDILIVDGPPYWVHPLSRFPAVPLLEPRLSQRSLIFLHDTGRHAEQRVLDMWLKAHPGWQAQEIETEVGAAVITTDPANPHGTDRLAGVSRTRGLL